MSLWEESFNTSLCWWHHSVVSWTLPVEDTGNVIQEISFPSRYLSGFRVATLSRKLLYFLFFCVATLALTLLNAIMPVQLVFNKCKQLQGIGWIENREMFVSEEAAQTHFYQLIRFPKTDSFVLAVVGCAETIMPDGDQSLDKALFIYWSLSTVFVCFLM